MGRLRSDRQSDRTPFATGPKFGSMVWPSCPGTANGWVRHPKGGKPDLGGFPCTTHARQLILLLFPFRTELDPWAMLFSPLGFAGFRGLG